MSEVEIKNVKPLLQQTVCYVQPFFETASFHIVKPCNMRCKFCYATFEDMHIVNQLSKYDAFKILDKLKEAGLQKITFAGGEPLLYKWIYEVIVYSKGIGLTTSIITNGSLLTDELLEKFKGKLDWIGISIDSLNDETNVKIGRTYKNKPNYYELVSKIKMYGFKLKINTVVNRYNEKESMQDFINMANPARWKVFDTLRVEGQNDKQFFEIQTSDWGYQEFLQRHNHPSMVCENNEAMTGSYLLIDPQGRLFENSKGKHTYSSPLQHTDIDKCLSEIDLNREMFVKRGGIYEW
jgi:radical S-adenosyl methionine domain-containing protein 2